MSFLDGCFGWVAESLKGGSFAQLIPRLLGSLVTGCVIGGVVATVAGDWGGVDAAASESASTVQSGLAVGIETANVEEDAKNRDWN